MEHESNRIVQGETEIRDHIDDLIGLADEIEYKIGKLNTLAVGYSSLLEAGAKSGEISVSVDELNGFKQCTKEIADDIARLNGPITGFRDKLLVLKQTMPLAGPPRKS